MTYKIEKEKLSLRDEIRELLKDIPKNTILDVSKVKYISPSAAHELLCFIREKNLKLINLNEEVKKMLEMQIKIRKMKGISNSVLQPITS
jgi:anti-anti-sigma regulatory factor